MAVVLVAEGATPVVAIAGAEVAMEAEAAAAVVPEVDIEDTKLFPDFLD